MTPLPGKHCFVMLAEPLAVDRLLSGGANVFRYGQPRRGGARRDERPRARGVARPWRARLFVSTSTQALALLQPLVLNRLILTRRAREVQPLIDVLLKHHIAARQQPGLFAKLERLVRMNRAQSGIQLLLQQRF